ncbi:hypothetical protein LCGC14_0954780 [marine sediment metagenome]|uniref:Uncharacterized protein n=1 Tax=marine sediment metagenome TaxID=412755 RepID=A0A0F9NKQ5_9ZZZZ|nr:hypothetical protein [bacterium]
MYYQSFVVAGVANVTTYDAGLVSLVEEPYHIDAILIQCDEWFGNTLECWIGNERIVEIPDYLLDTNDEAAVAALATHKINLIPIDMDIPPGQIFKAALLCAANANDIRGAYKYSKLNT